MFIFRFEHKRNECVHPNFRAGGDSLTGHGIATYCESYNVRPNFGHRGSPPARIAEYERCAVTANQFDSWIAERQIAKPCRNTTEYCRREQECWECAVYERSLNIPREWDLMAYWVEDNSFGIDWREDNDQICFNPEFATLIGPVTVPEVMALKDEYSLI